MNYKIMNESKKMRIFLIAKNIDLKFNKEGIFAFGDKTCY